MEEKETNKNYKDNFGNNSLENPSENPLKNTINISYIEHREKRKRNKKSFFKNIKKKIKLFFSSYLLTYKSLPTKKIAFFWSMLILALLFLLLSINTLSNKFMVEIPSYGGTWNEGIVGVPRYINPVLTISESDKDMTALIYSGLLKKDREGNMINNLAGSIEESEDNLTFTVTIKEKAKFQDGVKVTADDVLFTLAKIQDKNINSPLAINFEGVTAEKSDENTIIFHLKKPYYHFKESLDFGILPKHIWGEMSAEEFSLTEYNTKPVGSGPYKISNIIKNSNLAKEYQLTSFKNYVGGRPFIDKINIFIYQDNKSLLSGLNSGDIEATQYLDIKYFDKVANKNIISASLPNLFSLSFNPNKNNIFANKNVRTALATTIDKQDIINNIFNNYARKTDLVFPYNQDQTILDDNFNNQNFLDQKTKNSLASSTNGVFISRIDIAKNILGNSLKNKNMEINISTADIEDLKSVANKISEAWSSLGFKVNIKTYSLPDIADVIKNRDFEVLLFGSIINYDTDLYAYWHSSQRIYPGLNITGYASKKLDINLETLKNSMNKEDRHEALQNINKELSDENQIIPIYSNNFNYLITEKDLRDIVANNIPTKMKDGSERYRDVDEWYIYKEKVWRFSYFKNLQEKLSNIIH
ncbi:MAG: ABC transporter substrate-binding protein [Candidatus Paceibacterota bacterium]